jgi:hypothetical protein
MKPILFCFLLLGLAAMRAQDCVLLARFELTGGGNEYVVPNSVRPANVVALYRSAPNAGPMLAFVEVETTFGDRTSRSRLSNAAAGRLLDLFESLSLPDIDYQKHFETLAKAPPETRRGIAWLPDAGGARRESIELRTKDRVVRFEIWSPEVCLYSHPSDEIAQLVYRLIDGCSSAIGSPAVFLERSNG